MVVKPGELMPRNNRDSLSQSLTFTQMLPRHNGTHLHNVCVSKKGRGERMGKKDEQKQDELLKRNDLERGGGGDNTSYNRNNMHT